MAVIVIDRIAPYDGEHDLDLTWFSLGEEARIMDISQVLPLDYQDAILNAHPRFRVALAVVALERKGHKVEWLEPFWHAKREQVVLDFTRGPGVPEPVPPTESPRTNESKRGESESSDSSTEPGATDGEPSEESVPSDIGSRGSETNAV